MWGRVPYFLQNYISSQIQLQCVRHRYAIRGLPPTKAKSLKQVLYEMNYVDPALAEKIDIGLPPPPKAPKSVSIRQRDYIAQRKKDQELEKLSRTLKLEISLDDVKKEWIKTEAPYHVRTAAEHYGVFESLFGDAIFTPYIYLDVGYPQNDGKSAPVHRGNIVKPKEAASVPSVTFSANPSDLWTLILTNPDGHLTEENKEYVHWFVGNIPGGDISKGETVWDYLQPFPPIGIGFQRLVFILFKQEGKMDYSSLQQKTPCWDLDNRTFETLSFYRDRQDVLTPCGLAFFQSDWDPSVRDVFHHKLNMEEPRFEYDHTPRYVAPQKWFARRKPFNMYLDKYRKPKDIAKDFLLKKLADYNPLEAPTKPFPYPNIYRVNRKKTPSWLLTEQRRIKLGLGRINQQRDDD